ncbi:hypothetical protein ARSEF1564_000288 [Beauveria bassiana]
MTFCHHHPPPCTPKRLPDDAVGYERVVSRAAALRDDGAGGGAQLDPACVSRSSHALVQTPSARRPLAAPHIAGPAFARGVVVDGTYKGSAVQGLIVSRLVEEGRDAVAFEEATSYVQLK